MDVARADARLVEVTAWLVEMLLVTVVVVKERTPVETVTELAGTDS